MLAVVKMVMRWRQAILRQMLLGVLRGDRDRRGGSRGHRVYFRTRGRGGLVEKIRRPGLAVGRPKVPVHHNRAAGPGVRQNRVYSKTGSARSFHGGRSKKRLHPLSLPTPLSCADWAFG